MAYQRGHARQHRIHRAARQSGQALDAAVNQPGDAGWLDAAAARRSIDKPGAQRPKKLRDSLVHIALHGFGQPGDAQAGVRGQMRQPLNVGNLQPARQVDQG